MIKFIEKPNTNEEIFASLNPLVGKWFKEKFGNFCPAQQYSLLPIRNRQNLLLSAPTGSGKTLSAFGSILNYLIDLDEKGELENKVYAVYISPLKALAGDIEVNLKKPLKEMEKIAGREFNINIAMRTGDTSASDKQKMVKKSPHILICTPETLAIVLNSTKFSEHLKMLEFLIIDEIHALSNKRGVHLSLSIERLNEMSTIKPVRIGLSATVAPLEEVAKFLVGFEDGKQRSCIIADVQFTKKMDFTVISPVEDLIDTTAEKQRHGLYHTLDTLIQAHKTTLIFTNTRSATERVIHHLKEKFPTKYLDNIGAHHSSLSKEIRFGVEERLRKGELKVVVTSTSLELGIDIGYVDLVILLGSPKSVARAIQRCGRAGHKLHETSEAKLIVTDRDDLVECSVLLKEAMEGKIDRVQIPRNCLDVLAQQIFGMAIEKIWGSYDMLRVIRQSYCYHELTTEDFFSVISYLAGEYELNARNIYAKIWYDEKTGQIGKRGRLARVMYMTNVGTIPDESFINVVAARPAEKKDLILGSIDEGFLERIKKGDVFVLGGQKYEFLYSKGMNAYVNASVARPPTIPSWFSEMLPLSFDLAMAIQHFRKLMDEKFVRGRKKDEMIAFIKENLHLKDQASANSIYSYFYEQFKYAKIPHESRILMEYWRDDEKNYIIFHALFGRRVNDALSRALGYAVGQFGGRDIEIGINDNGFFLASHEKMQIDKAIRELNSKNIQDVLEEAVAKTDVFKRRFRHCATRGLMILRNYRGRHKSVGKQQVGSHFLLAAAQKASKDFPILREAKREIMEDVMDIANTRLILDRIKDGKIKIETISSEIPSPFALSLVMQGNADLMKVEDKIDFLKRMHKKIVKKIGGE